MREFLGIFAITLLGFLVGVSVGDSLRKQNIVRIQLPTQLDDRTSKIDCYVRWHKEIQGK